MSYIQVCDFYAGETSTAMTTDLKLGTMDLHPVTPLDQVYSSDEESVRSPSTPESREPSTLPSDFSPSSAGAPTRGLKWDTAGISYLTSILYPNLAVSDNLIFAPPLQSLSHHAGELTLQLFAHISPAAPPPEASSASAPIGTGRPASTVLLASSRVHCASVSEALDSLVSSLLSNLPTVNGVCAQYEVLSALCAVPEWRLESLVRGMRGLAASSVEERLSRRVQLGVVGVEDELEARLEAYLLWCGEEEVEGFVLLGGEILGMDLEGRMGAGRVYGDAAEFLKGAYFR